MLLPALALLALAATAGLLWLPPADPAQAQGGSGAKVTAGPTITSSPQTGDTYRQGEAIAVAVTFSEAVTVSGEPRVRLAVGEQTRWARYVRSEPDGTRLVFAYTVKENDRDDDGVSIKKNALGLNGGTIADGQDNAAKLKAPALPAQAGHRVDGSPPPAITAGPTIASSPASGDSYGKDEAIAVTVTFSEAVTVSGEPRVRLAVGERTRWARYVRSEQDGTRLVFAYTVKENDRDENGVSIGKNGLGLNGGSIADADGNAARLKAPALPDQSGHQVDGSPKPAQGEPAEPPAEGQQQQESPTPSNRPPAFAGASVTRRVNEDATVGANVGAAIVATDADGDTLTYALSGSESFAIDASGQITVRAGLDYETQASHSLTVTVSDGKNAAGEADASVDDTIAVTVSVVNVDEPGLAHLSLGPGTPTLGSVLSAGLMDPDGSVSGKTWSWQRSADGTTWQAIAGATRNQYTPSVADIGYYLRATVAYTDGHGPNKTASVATAAPVPAPVPASENSQQQVTSNQGSGQARVQRLEMASTGPYYYNDVIKIRAVFTGIPSGHTLLRQTASRSLIDKIGSKDPDPGTDDVAIGPLPGGFSGGSASISIKIGNNTVTATDCEIKDNTVTFCYRVPYSLWDYDPDGVSVDAGSIRFGDRFEDLTLVTAKVETMTVEASSCRVFAGTNESDVEVYVPTYCQIGVLKGQVYSENNYSTCASGCTHHYLTGMKKINAAHSGLSSPGASHLVDGLRIRDRASNNKVVKVSMDKAAYTRHGRSHTALSDPYLILYRVGSSGTLTEIASDDDSGSDVNAEIKRTLAPGNYMVEASDVNSLPGGYKMTFRSRYRTTVPPHKPLSNSDGPCQYTLRHEWYAYEGWFYNSIGSVSCDKKAQYYFTVYGDGSSYKYPSAPGNLSATAGDGQVTLTWDRKTNSGIYEWLLWREDDGKWRQISRDHDLNRHVVTGLTNGRTYKFALRAAYQSRGAMGVPSSIVSATPD